MACSLNDPVGCLSSAAKSVAGDAFSAIARDFANAADSTIRWLWGQLSAATYVHLGGPGFALDLGLVAAITGVVAVGLFLIQVMASVLRRDAGGLGRALKGLVIAFIAGGMAVGATNLVLAAVDSLSAGVVQVATGGSIDQMGRKVLGSGAIMAVGNPAGMFLLAIVAIAASVIVWAALLVRKALIVVSAVFAPLAFAGSLADITVGWTRRWIEVMAALIASKLVLVMIFIVGWGILDGGAGQSGNGGPQTVTQTATGLLILTMAGFAPWMALKLVHFGGDHFQRIHLLAGNATGGARAAAAAPQKAAAWKTAAGRLTPSANGSAVAATSPARFPATGQSPLSPPLVLGGQGQRGGPSGGGPTPAPPPAAANGAARRAVTPPVQPPEAHS